MKNKIDKKLMRLKDRVKELENKPYLMSDFQTLNDFNDYLFHATHYIESIEEKIKETEINMGWRMF